MKSLILPILTLAAGLSAQNSAITLSNTVDGFVEVPHSQHVVPQGGITVEAWVTYDETTIPAGWRYPTVVRQNRNAGQESFFLRVNADDSNRTVLRWLVHANTTVSVDWPFGPGQLLAWTHLAGTWDGQTARLFVDGQEVGSRTGSGALQDQGDVLRIGKGSDVGSPMEVWNGSIDEVRLWPFARTQAEIAATKDLELVSIPGQVSTWNFNQSAIDTSSGRDGTIGGTVTYTANTPALSPYTFPGAALGAGTDGCVGAIEATTSSIPRVGTAGFALVAHRTNPGAATVCVLGTQGAVSPLNIVGIDLWIDVPSILGGFGATVDALGVARMNLSIPASTPLGVSLAGQFVSIDACGPMGLTASNAILFAVLP